MGLKGYLCDPYGDAKNDYNKFQRKIKIHILIFTEKLPGICGGITDWL